LIQDLKGTKMSKTFIVLIAFMLILSLGYSIAEAGLFEEKLQVIDNKYEDEVFGGDLQQELIITFVPGDDLTNDEGEQANWDGDWFIIVDTDDDGDFNDDAIIAHGNATNGTAVTYRLNRNTLSALPDGQYEVAAIIDNIANSSLDWEEEETSQESLSLIFKVKDEYQITLVDFIMDLDERTVSAGLRQEFKANAITLSVSVAVETSGSAWTITDMDKTYNLVKNADDLEISGDASATILSVGDDVIDNLDKSAVSGKLWDAFYTIGATLSVRVVPIGVTVDTADSDWTITDVWDTYILNKGNHSLGDLAIDDLEIKNGLPFISRMLPRPSLMI